MLVICLFLGALLNYKLRLCSIFVINARYKVLHVGKDNAEYKYSIDSSDLECTEVEKRP